MKAAGAGTVADRVRAQAVADLESALHDLAQPLTALAFLTQLATTQTDTTTWKDALKAGEVETTRAMQGLRRARDAAARLNRTGKTVIGGSIQ
jgi:hypothetical protein